MDKQVPSLVTAARPIVVTMPAEIDNGNAGEVSARLSAAVSSGAAVVIADLAGTTFCTTAGIQALVRTSGHAAGRGASYGWWCPRPVTCSGCCPSAGWTAFSPVTPAWARP